VNVGAAVTPVYVEPFLGGGGSWLPLLTARHLASLVPPVAWMGGKRKLAPVIHDLLGLDPVRPAPCILGDACWWGEVWPLVLDPTTGPAVSEVLRSWQGEDPTALWLRLRDAGPSADPVEHTASLLWLQAGAASGVPVWWRDDGSAGGPGFNTGQANAKGSIGGPVRLTASNGRGMTHEAGHRQRHSEGGKTGGVLFPATVAARLDAIRLAAAAWPITVEHDDAQSFTERWAPRLGERARVYLDPPYEGKTSYPSVCPRSEVLSIARTWASHGARVVLSEAVDLSGELGPGWSGLRLRGGRKQEWVTSFGCRRESAYGPLFMGGAP